MSRPKIQYFDQTNKTDGLLAHLLWGFTKDGILSKWESRQAQRWQLPSDYRGPFLLSEWSLGSWTGWSLMEADSNHLWDSSHRLGGRVFDVTMFVPEPSRQPSPTAVGGRVGGWLKPQSKCIKMNLKVTTAQRWKGKACVLHLWPFPCQAWGLGGHRSGCCAPRLLMCNLFITIFASSSCLSTLSFC